MSTKAVRLLLMFLFGQVVQTAVMLIGFALDMNSIIWWTVVSGLVIFCSRVAQAGVSPHRSRTFQASRKSARNLRYGRRFKFLD